MTELQIAAEQPVLPARRCGDTLIVRPAGSLAGFGVGEAHREEARLAHLLAEPGVENLIIDLHNADYFGTEMVGVFHRLRQSCHRTAALVGVAPGMRKVLDVMQFEGFFSFYHSERQALRAIARIPLRERLRRRFNSPTRFAALAFVLVVVGWFGWTSNLVYQVVGCPVARDYCALNDLWAEFQQLDQHARNNEVRVAALNELNRDFERLNLENSVRSTGFVGDGPEAKSLRDALGSFETVLQNDGDPRDEMTFLHYMYSARNGIRRHTGISVPAPASRQETDNA